MPLHAQKTCGCTQPCGCNETEICPEIVEEPCPCPPDVAKPECEKIRIPFGDEYDKSFCPYPAGSLVNSPWGLYYTPCETYAPLGKKPWEKFHVDKFFKVYSMFVLISCQLNIRPIGCPDFCAGVEKRLVFQQDDIGFYNGKLWISQIPENSSLPPNSSWGGGKSVKQILSDLILS